MASTKHKKDIDTKLPARSVPHPGDLAAFTALLSSSVLEHPPYEVTLAAACELAFLKDFKHLSLNDIEAASRSVCLQMMYVALSSHCEPALLNSA